MTGHPGVGAYGRAELSALRSRALGWPDGPTVGVGRRVVGPERKQDRGEYRHDRPDGDREGDVAGHVSTVLLSRLSLATARCGVSDVELVQEAAEAAEAVG